MVSALVPYRSASAPTLHSFNASALKTHLFTTQTGQALATELLYRLLFDLLNRLFATLHRHLSHRLDTFGSYLERRWESTLEAVKAARGAEQGGAGKTGEGKLRIVEEAGKAAMQRGFIGGPGGGGFTPCSTGESREWRRPPGWVGSVLEGIQEGRMVERDFWVQPFSN